MQTAHDHTHTAPATGPKPRLTVGRKRVLDVLAREGRPLGAYDIIDRVAAATGRRLAPVTVYRALDFLVEHGLVHRLASRNAFLACGHTHDARESVAFLICESCGVVKEASSPPMVASLENLAAAAGFESRTRIVEIAGVCGTCRGAA